MILDGAGYADDVQAVYPLANYSILLTKYASSQECLRKSNSWLRRYHTHAARRLNATTCFVRVEDVEFYSDIYVLL